MHMVDSAISKTAGCQFDFRCRDKHSRHPVCTVAGSNGENVLFVRNDTDASWRYCRVSDKGEKCTCPTHYAIHDKLPYMNRILKLGRENSGRWPDAADTSSFVNEP